MQGSYRKYKETKYLDQISETHFDNLNQSSQLFMQAVRTALQHEPRTLAHVESKLLEIVSMTSDGIGRGQRARETTK